MLIDEYLTKMKGLADQMEVVGQLVQDSELIILAGLDHEYDSVIFIQLLNVTQESRIEQLNAMNQITDNVATNHTGTNGKPHDHGTNFNNRGRSDGNPLGCGRYQGRGGGGCNGGLFRRHGQKPACQVCGKIGHIAVVCYYKFDQDYNNQTSGY
ncbi:hypothetical protein JRO89_XS02G0282600 [Xanthoceras sorbifolium]|uniref:CCHC-type domain-containing protein n=1 Tax=Xanthoceras sorbifolium TaxID=99658 RepID=A0ABQ8IHS5_9ROSI|nr:hypothetical protein JRO89_XS02G0282600 [Xanthoceras sorbifolium]